MTFHPFMIGMHKQLLSVLFYDAYWKKAPDKVDAQHLFLKMGLRKLKISCIMEKDEIV